MIIHTSYFARLRTAVHPVSISLYTPQGIDIPKYLPLAPTPQILSAYRNHLITKYKYKERYKEEVLAHLDKDKVVADLRALTNSDEVTLICFEKDGTFCHRHIVYSWLTDTPLSYIDQ